MKTPATRVATLGLVSAAVVVAAVAAWLMVLAPRTQPAPPPVAAETKPAADPAKPPANVTANCAVEEATSAVEALTKTLAPPPGKPAEPSGPVFDAARISPNGEAVIAGRAEPGASVELLRDGVVHDKAVADRSGAFVIVPDPLPPGDYSLMLRATGPNGAVSTSKGSVAVSVHADKAAKTAAAPAAPKSPAAETPATGVRNPGNAEARITTVELRGSGKLYVAGQSAPGAVVKLYLNGTYIASATASASGEVAFSIESGVVPGDYRVRLDQVEGTGAVRAHAEQSFRVPAANAVASLPQQQPPRADAPASAGGAAAPRPEPTQGTSTLATPKLTESNATATATNNARPITPPPPPVPLPAAPAASAPAPQATPPAAAPQLAAPSPEPPPAPSPNKPAPAPDQTATGPQQSSQVAGAQPVPSAPTDAKVVVVPKIDTASVRSGDNLWNISRSTYGEGIQYPRIVDANRDQIRDPDLIFPGQIFVLPRTPSQ